MPFFNHNNIPPGIHMTHFSWKVRLTWFFIFVPSLVSVLISDRMMFIMQIEPSTTKTLPEDYVARVKQVHESGGYGSRG